MINLAISKHSNDAQYQRIRHVTLLTTSIVLGVWVVALAGFLSWTWFINNKSQNTTTDLANLKQAVLAKSEDEVLLRSLASRTTAVKQFLDSRGDPSKHLDILLTATPGASSWQYQGLNMQKIGIVAQDVNTIQDFVTSMTNSYKSVKLENVTLKKDEGWSGIISVSGLKPTEGVAHE